jgi:hypothetical protein
VRCCASRGTSLAPPPQAPSAQAQQVGRALAEIAEACGEYHQTQAFHATLAVRATLEQKASASALRLTAVYREDPS